MVSLFRIVFNARRVSLLASRTLPPIRSMPRLNVGHSRFLAHHSGKVKGPSIEPSAEQAAIVRAVTSGSNVVVNAVVGSGKTATIQFIAEALPSTRIQVLTYNRRLKDDTALRLRSFPEVSVDTFHGFVSQIYKRPCLDDAMLNSYLMERRKSTETETIPLVNILIVDEVQDLNPLLYELVLRICKDSCSPPQLVILGDQYQAIYQYRGSDARYLTRADKLFSHVNTLEWKSLDLRTSYRLSKQTAACVDKAFLKQDRMQGFAPGEPPKYYVVNTEDFARDDAVSDTLVHLIKKYKARNTMVLALSLFRNQSTRSFERFLVQEHKIPVYVPVGEEREPHPVALKGKVVFSTFHQAKGRQADLVIVFDAEWRRFYRHYAPYSCPNPLYVGLTRARKQLVILQNTKSARLWKPIPLPFVDYEALRATTSDDSHLPIIHAHYPVPTYPKRPLTVTDLCRHLHFEAIGNAVAQINVTTRQGPLPKEDNQIMKIRPVWKKEEVSDLTGTAMQVHLESELKGSDVLQSPTKLLRKVTWDDSGRYCGRYFQLKDQPNGFGWVAEAALRECRTRFRRASGGHLEHLQTEAPIEKCIKDLTDGNDSIPDRLTGMMDVRFGKDPVTIFELKFTSELKPVHILQLALYGWMYEGTSDTRPQLMLFNLKTNELLMIEPPAKKVMSELVRNLLHAKYRGNDELEDEEFFAMNSKVKESMR